MCKVDPSMTEGCHHAKFQAVCVRSFRENGRLIQCSHLCYPLNVQGWPFHDGIKVVIMQSFKYFAYSASGKMADLYSVAICVIPLMCKDGPSMTEIRLSSCKVSNILHIQLPGKWQTYPV